MKAYVKSRLEGFFSSFARRSDVENLYKQFSALLDVKEIVGPGTQLGTLRGWALSPDALLVVLREIQRRTSPVVVEFGSGESTIAIAATLKGAGAGRLITVEHDSNYADRIASRLARSDLSKFVDIRLAPLRDYDGLAGFPVFRSYDLAALDVDFDIALVDGPVWELGLATRLVPLQWAVDRIHGDRVVYLDDAARPPETAIAAHLRTVSPNIFQERIDCEKGLIRFAGVAIA
ncbi:MAG: class I SAM-dependent methyltransferase [Hyphomicrobium sp.]